MASPHKQGSGWRTETETEYFTEFVVKPSDGNFPINRLTPVNHHNTVCNGETCPSLCTVAISRAKHGPL